MPETLVTPGLPGAAFAAAGALAVLAPSAVPTTPLAFGAAVALGVMLTFGVPAVPGV
jgi:hypothetical protein